MSRNLKIALVVCLVWAGIAIGQPKPEEGKLKSVDAKKKLVVITSGGKDREFTVTEKTRLPDGRGDTAEEKLSGYKPGTDIQFLARDSVLVGMRRKPTGGGGVPGKPVSPDHSKFKPLTELGTEKYNGSEGGLYPGGKNDRPEKHEKAGLDLAKKVQPLAADGKPSDKGKIVLLSIGMSNTMQISQGFQQALRGAKGVNPAFVFVNGAQGGMTAQRIQDPDDGKDGTRYWKAVDDQLKRAGVTRLQVQAVWIKQADAGPSEGFPTYPKKLQRELKKCVQVIAKRFPNARLCYLSSRTYGGYATTRLNPEPYAYESGFAVKWLIEDQLKGDKELDFASGKAPWLSWGPYLWANGKKKNPDGLFSVREDFGPDGTHHTTPGLRKMGEQLLRFMQTDSTTKGWFGKTP
jgi:hypothetical protein